MRYLWETAVLAFENLLCGEAGPGLQILAYGLHPHHGLPLPLLGHEDGDGAQRVHRQKLRSGKKRKILF
jgi:hypothetical protein